MSGRSERYPVPGPPGAGLAAAAGRVSGPAVAAGVAGPMLGALVLIVSGGQPHYLVGGGVLVVSGAVLLWRAGTQAHPSRAGWLFAAVLAAAGLLLSLFVARHDVCCMFAYRRGLGYPWAWLDAGGTSDTMAGIEMLRSHPGMLDWHLDWPKLAIDAIFWAYVALLLVAVTPTALRLRRRPPTITGFGNPP